MNDQTVFKVGSIVEHVLSGQKGVIINAYSDNVIVEFDPSIVNPNIREVRIISESEFSTIFRLCKGVKSKATITPISVEDFSKKYMKTIEEPVEIAPGMTEERVDVAESALGPSLEPMLNLAMKLEPIYENLIESIESSKVSYGPERDAAIKALKGGESLPENLVLDFKLDVPVFYYKNKLESIFSKLHSDISILPWHGISKKMVDTLEIYTLQHITDITEQILNQAGSIAEIEKPSDLLKMLFNTLLRLRGHAVLWEHKKSPARMDEKLLPRPEDLEKKLRKSIKEEAKIVREKERAEKAEAIAEKKVDKLAKEKLVTDYLFSRSSQKGPMQDFKIGSKVYIKELFTPFILVSSSPCMIVSEEELFDLGFADPVRVSPSDISFKTLAVDLNDHYVDPVYGHGVVKDISRVASGFVGVKYDIGKYDDSIPVDKFMKSTTENFTQYNIRQCGLTGAFVLPSIYCASSQCEYCEKCTQKCLFDINEFLNPKSNEIKKVEVKKESVPTITNEELLEKLDFDVLTTRCSYMDTTDFKVGDKIFNEKTDKYGNVLIVHSSENCMEVQWKDSPASSICWFNEVKKVIEEKM